MPFKLDVTRAVVVHILCQLLASAMQLGLGSVEHFKQKAIGVKVVRELGDQVRALRDAHLGLEACIGGMDLAAQQDGAAYFYV